MITQLQTLVIGCGFKLFEHREQSHSSSLQRVERCICVALRLMSCRSRGVNDGRLPRSIRGPHECRRMGFFLFSIPSPCYPVLSGMQEMVAEHFLSEAACVNDPNAHWASCKPIQGCFYSSECLFLSFFCCLSLVFFSLQRLPLIGWELVVCVIGVFCKFLECAHTWALRVF